MARNVVAIFDDFQTANSAVRDIVDSGFPRDNISVIANNSRGDYGHTPTTTTQSESSNVNDETGAGAGVGAGVGAAVGGVGGLLVGLGALTIPGIGPVIAAGPLAVALSTLTGAGVGAVAGGVTGGLLGVLIGQGIPEEEAEYYAEGVRRGGVLVTVHAEDHNTNQFMDILNRHNPIDINERVTEWRNRGWSGFDPNSGPYEEDRKSMEKGTWESMDYNDDATDFNMENPIYRNHYSSYLADSGYPFDYYVPAYRFGYELYSNQRYQNSGWKDIEMEARQSWEREHPGTWDQFKKAVRHAWENITDRI